jgi:uncharacterized protein VirK/YbjX
MTPTIQLIPAALKQLVQHKEYWSAHRIARGMIYLPSMLATIPALYKLLKVLTVPSMMGLLHEHPMLPFKYLSKFYISRGLSKRSRAAAITHHYGFIRNNFCETLLADTLHRRALILESQTDTAAVRIYMALSSQIFKEGELSLYLQVDGVDIYVLSFSFISGKIVESPEETVILIGRIQGIRGCFPQIRAATKALHDISPPALLVSALQGIAQALDITCMAGISAADHVARSSDKCPELIDNYDAFFAALGANKNDSNFFVGDFMAPEKPITLVKRSHRSRALKKRAFKRQISETTSRYIYANRANPNAYSHRHYPTPVFLDVAESP